MPLYEYKCDSCGSVFEVREKFSDEPLLVHESCGGRVERLISTSAFVFKGTGFYATDYKRKGGGNGSGDGKAKDEALKAEAKADAKADARAGGKSDAKTEVKTESKPAAPESKKPESKKPESKKPASAVSESSREQRP